MYNVQIFNWVRNENAKIFNKTSDSDYAKINYLNGINGIRFINLSISYKDFLVTEIIGGIEL